jgi:hypothetical protein
MLIIFFDIKGIVHKEFALAGQTVNSAYYCDILWQQRESVRRLRLELWQQTNRLLHQENEISHSFFLIREFLKKKKHICRPPSTSFSVSAIEDNTEWKL